MNLKKTILSFLIALLTVSAFARVSPAGPDAVEEKSPGHGLYRDIPGVTPEEAEAIEALRKEKVYIVYGTSFSAEAFYNEYNQVDGFALLLSEWLTSLFGIQFEPKIVEKDPNMSIIEDDPIISGMMDGSIDFSGEIDATEENKGKYFMSDPISGRSVKVVRIKDSERLIPPERDLLRTPRYAFMLGSGTYRRVREFINGRFDGVLARNYEVAYALMKKGVVDALLADNVAEIAFDSYDDVVVDDFFPFVYNPVSLSTLKPELMPIISVLNRALRDGRMGDSLIELYDEGRRRYARHRLFARLNQDERDYLKNLAGMGVPIRVAAEYDNYPLSFYNRYEKEWQGVAFDVLRELEKLTGLSFVMANETLMNPPQLVEMLRRRDASMITSLTRSPENEGEFLRSDTPYQFNNLALISRTGFREIDVNDVRYFRVGLIAGSAYESVFREWFRNHASSAVYNTAGEAFDALEREEVDLVMGTQNLLLLMTNYLEKPGYKSNLVFKRSYDSYFGFNINESKLRAIVNKSLPLIDTPGISEGWARRTFDYRMKMASVRLPWLAGTILLLMCLLALTITILHLQKWEEVRLISVVRERTRELELQTEVALAASMAKGDFLARMSHEIRTPLNAIIGMAKIAEKTAAGGKTLNSIKKIGIASEHLLGVLNDVLDVSKIESGKFTLAREKYRLRSAMTEVADIIAHRCAEKKITFSTNFRDMINYEVMGDKLRLKQVMINLLGNAVKFTHEGGRIDFSVDVLSESDSEITCSFAVADDGIGMSEEQAGRIFHAFEQADANIAGRFGGTGLGLSISQNLVSRMGGAIEVKSRPGEGATFKFDIVMEKIGRGAEEEERREFGVCDLSGKRILLVEDIEINREIMSELLEETNVEIEEAEDGQKAVERFVSSPLNYYDLILMDVQMPNMDGYEATRRIRASNRQDSGEVPIIAMTANAYREDIERALSSGMNGHLAKPINIDDVIRTLADVLLA